MGARRPYQLHKPRDERLWWDRSPHTGPMALHCRGLDVSKVVTVGFEWYGSFGEVSQKHQYYPTTDLRLGDDVTLHLGVGFGGTSAGDRLVFKTRFEMPFGGEKN